MLQFVRWPMMWDYARFYPKFETIFSFVKNIPFFLFHVAAFILPFIVGWSLPLVGLCLISYFIRMFFLTAGYHRYFSHRTYKTSRFFQFILAVGGTLCLQKGVLWWAANHRIHHAFTDQPDDIHSPVQNGFWWSHIGWILSDKHEATQWDKIKDFSKFPELVALNKIWMVPPILLFALLYLLGGLPALAWGGIIATVLLWHGTFTVNSFTHMFGKNPFPFRPKDNSKNVWWLVIPTMGEGYHAYHHYHQSSASQAWHWYEVDLSYMILWTLSKLGLVWDLRPPPTPEQIKYIMSSH